MEGAAAEGADIVDGVKNMIFGSEEEEAAADADGAVGGLDQVIKHVKQK